MEGFFVLMLVVVGVFAAAIKHLNAKDEEPGDDSWIGTARREPRSSVTRTRTVRRVQRTRTDAPATGAAAKDGPAERSRPPHPEEPARAVGLAATASVLAAAAETRSATGADGPDAARTVTPDSVAPDSAPAEAARTVAPDAAPPDAARTDPALIRAVASDAAGNDAAPTGAAPTAAAPTAAAPTDAATSGAAPTDAATSGAAPTEAEPSDEPAVGPLYTPTSSSYSVYTPTSVYESGTSVLDEDEA
ncbi:MAG: hypothetical protein ABGX90_03455, partial [Brachybacterium sp.]